MGDWFSTATDILGDSLHDTLYLIPFLCIVYLAMEWLEHKAGLKTQQAIQQAGYAGPLIGAICGALPQCGFSAMASTLYAGRVITVGTLFAVLLSTSDEMIPIFLSRQISLVSIAQIIGLKIVIALFMGMLIDLTIRCTSRNASNQTLRIHELCTRDKCLCHQGCDTCNKNPELVYTHHDDCTDGCDHTNHLHDHNHDATLTTITKSALIHTIQITVFIFIVNVVINVLLNVIGEDVFTSWLASNQPAAIFGSALVGLIPNCAASVVIAELYIEGVLTFPAMMSGLLVSTGVGLLVLLRTDRQWKQNIAIIAVLYLIGVVWGLIFSALGIAF